MSLNILNYLIGKDDFDSEFRLLLKENPGVAQAIPALAIRGQERWEVFLPVPAIS